MKEALWLFYFEDLSYAEAADIMGIRTKQFDHLLSRGKEEMRRELMKEGVDNANE